MRQLVVFCEGATEQGFCRQVLRPHPFPSHEGLLHTLPVGEQQHHHVYGIRNYARLKRFILNTLHGRKREQVYFTTLIDLYGLPAEFPGKREHVRNPGIPTPYVEALEQAFGADIGDFRFIPYLQLHEYETILFADADAFRISFDDHDAEIDEIKSIAASFPTIEHINDGELTAPSKRIIKVIPAYAGNKSSAGPDIAEFIGAAVIRAKCAHFDGWLTKLETLDWQGG